MKNKNALVTKKLKVWYENRPVLHGIDLTIKKQQITALIGASGSGKSTFLRSINRILETNPVAKIEGDILVGDTSIFDDNLDVTNLRRKIGMVFQSPTPFPKSIYENVAYGLVIQGIKHQKPWLWWQKKPTGAELENSFEPLDLAVVESLKEAALWHEVKDRLHNSALKLSGGQQQRLCIARAIAIKPEVLLLDEPCSALDPISTKKIETLLLKLKQKYTIVIVTHNLPQAKRISDQVGFFHLGKLIEFGSTEQIFSRPKAALTQEYVGGHFG